MGRKTADCIKVSNAIRRNHEEQKSVKLNSQANVTAKGWDLENHLNKCVMIDSPSKLEGHTG
jgi:hypothetical protein